MILLITLKVAEMASIDGLSLQIDYPDGTSTMIFKVGKDGTELDAL